jgi:L-cystine uptake protein TcyP (sodium:dicarboxylate symporter family)
MIWLAWLPIVIFLVALFGLYRLQQRGLSFSLRVAIGLCLGALLGLGLQWYGQILAVDLHDTHQWFRLIGFSYLALLKMLVIPLVITSIVHAILGLGKLSMRVIKQVAWGAVAMLLGTTALASAIGMGTGLLMGVGHHLHLPDRVITPAHHYHGVVDTLLHMLPSNPVAVMAQDNTIAMVIFAVLVGVAALMIMRSEAEKGRVFAEFIASTFHISKKLASMVIALTPYGVLGLIALVFSTQGSRALLGILDYILAMYVAMVVVIVMHLVIAMCRGVSPWRYLKLAYPALLVAFTTRSSLATLPVSEETLRDRFGRSQITSSFLPSIGATLGMNACAGIFPAMLVVMVLTILHQPVTWVTFVQVMLVNALASLGISGIPGTAYVAAAVTLSTLNLPYSIIALVQGVDPVVDMGRTATNVSGVMASALVVDKAAYHSPEDPAVSEVMADSPLHQ